MEGYTKTSGSVIRTTKRKGFTSYLVRDENNNEIWYPHGSVIEVQVGEVYIKDEEYNKKR